MPRRVDRFWESDWSLTVLLVFLVVFVFFVRPLDVLGYDGQLVGGLVFTLMLVSGILTVARSRTTVVVFGAVAVATTAVRWARYAIFGDAWIGVDMIASFVACGLLAAIVLSHVFREGPITRQRIEGAIAAYLLIALMFATAYTWIDIHSSNAFSSVVSGTDDRSDPAARFVYFSFTTLTTVGYGDITPVHSFARSMAMLEALIGQIFPAILLARLVSMELLHRQSRLDREP